MRRRPDVAAAIEAALAQADKASLSSMTPGQAVAIMGLAAGNNDVIAEALSRKMSALTLELSGPSPTMLDEDCGAERETAGDAVRETNTHGTLKPRS
jgi:hypothetical protein